MCERWLRLEGNEMSLSDRHSLMKDVSGASDAREKSIERLGLNVASSDSWDALGKSPEA